MDILRSVDASDFLSVKVIEAFQSVEKELIRKQLPIAIYQTCI